MAWARLDDKFWSHPKVRKAGTLAAGAYAQALSYASDHLTDGFIPDYMLGAIADVSRYDTQEHVVADLVEAGLFEPVAGGWRIHDFTDWNPSREKVEAIRDKRAEAGRAGGQRSGESRRASSNHEANTKQVASVSLEAKTNPVPIPSHPIPTDPYAIGTRPRTPPARASADPGAREDAGADGLAMSKEWYNDSWRRFRDRYGKTPPRGLAQRWPEFCPDEATRAAIMSGLDRWLVSRAWRENNPHGDKVTKCETWLAEKRYLEYPAPYDLEGGHEKPEGHPDGDADARKKVYALGDNDDPYWAENHGLLSEVRKRKRDIAAGLPVPDDGRTGVGGTVPAVPGRRVAQA